MPPPYATGHVRHPQKNHLQQLSARRHRQILQQLLQAPLPSSFDSRSQGWIGPIKNQKSCGSCASADTEVLTDKGWVSWPDYDWKRPLGTMNLATGFLEFQPPLVQHIYDHDGPMYYYDGRSTDFAMTPDHRMVVSRNGMPWQKIPVSELPSYVDTPHATRGWLGTQLDKVTVGNRQYSGDDFLALVALVISDGFVGHDYDGNGGQNNITFCCFNEARQEAIRALAYRLGIPEQRSRPGVWYWRDGALAEWFRQNAYGAGGYTASYKHVPALVKCASQQQIANFLQYFGDQHTQAYGGRRFYSCSSLMVDDLQELLLRIGKRGTIEEHPPRTAHRNAVGQTIVGKHPEFMLTERKRDGLSIEKKNTHVDYYKGKVYCATVANGTLVTRRNKRVLISSNCWDFSGTCVVEIAYYKAGVLKPDGSEALSEQYTLDCGRNGGCNGDDNITVLQGAKQTGIPKTSEYGPYQGRATRCNFKQTETLYKVDDWGFADGSQGQGITPAQAIKAAIFTYGCVGAAIAADGAFQSAKPGQVFQGSGSRSINHDIVLVGWDDSKGSGGKTAWLLRNSWDVEFCDQGYCWILEGANEVGTEACWAHINAAAPPIDWYV